MLQEIIKDNPVDIHSPILNLKENIDLVPSNVELSGVEVDIANMKNGRDSVLKSYVSKVKKNYDFILIDCLPSLGMLTVNALAASNSVIIPTQPHFFSAKGLEQLLRTVSKVRYEINPKLRIDGIIMTLVMSRTNMNKEVISTIKNSYGHKIKVFDTMIPFSIRAVEATAEGKSIFEYEEKRESCHRL